MPLKIDRPSSISADAPQFLKDEIDSQNKEFCATHGLNHIPATWNSDSRDGSIKGTENNCTTIALSDSGAMTGGPVWLSVMQDAPGKTLQDFAKAHPKGSFLVCFNYAPKPNMYPPQHGTDHYSALVDGVLFNASNSALGNKINYVFEVLHEKDLTARGWTVEQMNEASKQSIANLSDGMTVA